MEEKVTIIVGASSGMGAAAARLFAGSGSRVILAARSSDRLQELSAELGDRAAAVATDVQRREVVENLIRSTEDSEKRIDHLLYFTGTNIPERSIDVLTEQTWEMMLRTNLTGAFHCTQAVLPIMRRQKQGLILYISSAAAKVPDGSGVSYQASKRGLVGLAHPHLGPVSGVHRHTPGTEASRGYQSRDTGSGTKTGGCSCGLPVRGLSATPSLRP